MSCKIQPLWYMLKSIREEGICMLFCKYSNWHVDVCIDLQEIVGPHVCER